MCQFQIGDVIRRAGDDTGWMKVVEIRDLLEKPLKGKYPHISYFGRRQRWPSRYLLTCVRPDGQFRSVYHDQAEWV